MHVCVCVCVCEREREREMPPLNIYVALKRCLAIQQYRRYVLSILGRSQISVFSQKENFMDITLIKYTAPVLQTEIYI